MTESVALIKPAATVILWREGASENEVLMGQRGASAVFMPSKYVFPGGGVEDGDDAPTFLVSDVCLGRLERHCPTNAPAPHALIGAALRELQEETGLTLNPTARLQFVFRAITPPGRSRRFDARFFLVSARELIRNSNDFSGASGELNHLHWIGLNAARSLDLPFITEVVLSEVTALLAGRLQSGVPFFDNSGSVPTFRRIA